MGSRDIFGLSVIHVAQQSLAQAKLSSTSVSSFCCEAMSACRSLPSLVLHVVFGDLALGLVVLQP